MLLHVFLLTKRNTTSKGQAFHIVAHSFGCILALELAARHPQRVRSLILLAPPYFPSAAAIEGHFIRGNNLFGSGFVFGSAVWLRYPWVAKAVCTAVCQRRHVWDKLLPAVLRKVVPHAEIVKDYLKHSYYSAQSTFEHCLLRHRLDDTLRRIVSVHRGKNLPIRIIFGESDRVVPVLHMEQFLSTLFSDSMLYNYVCGASLQ